MKSQLMKMVKKERKVDPINHEDIDPTSLNLELIYDGELFSFWLTPLGDIMVTLGSDKPVGREFYVPSEDVLELYQAMMNRKSTESYKLIYDFKNKVDRFITIKQYGTTIDCYHSDWEFDIIAGLAIASERI